MTPLPTRKQEAWRYADLAALAPLWPLPAPETVAVAAGGQFTREIVLDRAGVVQLDLMLEAGASASVHVLNAGAGYGRVELAVRLGEGAEFHLGAGVLARGGDTREVVAQVVHAEPGATSRQVIRSVVADTAHAVSLAKVKVERHAVGTDAEQSLRAMLLDRTAQASAKPELEIHADDVKCAHGCAIGELDAGALFYMAQRGLPPETAKRLMLQAFLAEAFVGATGEEALTARALALLEEML